MQNEYIPVCQSTLIDDELIIPENADDIFFKLSKDKDDISFIIYSKRSLSLSQLIPIFNDFGLEVQSEVRYKIKEYFLHKFLITNQEYEILKLHEKNLFDVFKETLKNRLKRGSLFTLVIKENFCKRGILLTRSLLYYIDELIDEYHQKELINTLIKYPSISRSILDLFLVKFNPNIDDRQKRVEIIKKELNNKLREVMNINDDRIIKYFIMIVDNIVRTNFFSANDTIAHKIILTNFKDTLRGIQPNIEIFVYSSDLVGTHLRMSLVSRGGIRWSKRGRGFRQEIKSLMATQEAKNAIIIPSGAKGGFIINSEKEIDKESFKEYYSRYINALLDLIDTKQNRINDDLVVYDKLDNYFVVAADRGTSNMSNIANIIAKERSYWIDDAFASGSSTGFHHKKLGVTAKGAIYSASVHLKRNNKDIFKDEISVVGIGSMSGDVFGNGMLINENFKLIAAISHDEIFIDPNPDIKLAFHERKRLFFETSGKWREYDQKKISEGGGVFKRSDPSIKISDQIKRLIGSNLDYLSGEDLAREILKLRVDMLYFGGIGTYVKASNESNIQIGDKENEYVRVDANKLNAYCICEGANLALTMEARIEYSLNGGFINLDSIDNSAGVDTSDHEVNFKILLNMALKNGKIEESQRVELLKSVSDFVLDKVTNNTLNQSLCISKDQENSKNSLKTYKKVVRILESKLDTFKRSFFLIPKERDFIEVIDNDGKIVRPTIAILLLYSKIFLQNLLLKSDLLDKQIYQNYLYSYFPDLFLDKFKEEIDNHPMRDEIISVMVANELINKNGISFIADFDKLGEKEFLKKVDSLLVFTTHPLLGR